jgi:hypothetical protein
LGTWRTAAYIAIWETAAANRIVTTDDVWLLIRQMMPPRPLGGLIQVVAGNTDWLRSSGQKRPSVRGTGNRIRVWESLIFGTR